MSTISRTIWRRYFERVETEEPMIILPTNIINDDDDDDDDADDDNVNDDISTDTIDTTSIPLATATAVEEEEEEDIEINNDQQAVTTATTTTTTSDNENDNNNDHQSDDTNNEFGSLTLRELEERRDDALRRSGACSMLGSYVLMILWLQVFTTNNSGLLLLVSILCTFWFSIYNQAAQERFDTLNQMVLDRNVDNDTTADASITNRRANSSGGVGEIVKQNWDTFLFNSRASLVKKENFGIKNNKNNHRDHNDKSLFTIDDDDDNNYEDDDDDIVNELVEEGEADDADADVDADTPECSICLGEYEKGDELVSLNPCRHVFHEECISAWTNQNTRCPLCNIDLVNELQQQQQQQQQSPNIDPSYSLAAANMV